MRDLMERRIIPPTWDLAPPCKQALRICSELLSETETGLVQFFAFTLNMSNVLFFNIYHFLFLFLFFNHER